MKEEFVMRKKHFTIHVAVLLDEDCYQQLVELTDKLEVTLSGHLRTLLERELKEKQQEE
jgi:DNA-binding transcriptional ArsR family regulator